MRPMSWCSGSQNTPESSPHAWAMVSKLWSKLAWVTMTPLGVFVDPEVY